MKQKLTEEGRTFIEKIKAMNIKATTGKAGFDRCLPLMYRMNFNCLPCFNAYHDEFEKRYTEYCEIDGCKTYIVQGSDDYDKVVFYLHGGAYVLAPAAEHFQACAEMADQMNARLYFVMYPLAPKATYLDCYRFLDELYARICADEPDKTIIFMGDSSGGGLALAYSQYLAQQGCDRLPRSRVLISPWVDVTMRNDKVMAAADEDIFLDRYAVGITGQMWAGNDLWTDPRISPLFGSLDDGIPTLFIAGEKEMLLSDIRKAHLKLKRKGCDSTLIVGEGMFHVYPIYHFDMGLAARKMIEEFIDRH